jgi:putative membrane protein
MDTPNISLGKTLDKYAIALTVIVLIAVPYMHFMPKPLAAELPAWIRALPLANAVLNTLASISLLLSLYFIKRKDIANHQRMNIAAMALSALFLVLYIIYHTFSDPTRFGDIDHSGLVDATEQAAVATSRIIYLIILNTHIIAAAVIFPFILFTFIRGYTMQVEKHRSLARFTYPLWLYVTITGPLCYILLMPYYK